MPRKPSSDRDENVHPVDGSNLPSLEQVRNAGINDAVRYRKADEAISSAEQTKYEIDLAYAERLFNANRVGVVIDDKVVKLSGDALAALAKSWDIGKTVAYKLINVHEKIGEVVPWANEVFETTGHWPSRDALCEYANPEPQTKLPSAKVLAKQVAELKQERITLRMEVLIQKVRNIDDDAWTCEAVREEFAPIYDEVDHHSDFWETLVDQWVPDLLHFAGHDTEHKTEILGGETGIHVVFADATDVLFIEGAELQMMTWDNVAKYFQLSFRPGDEFALEETGTPDRQQNVHQVDATPTVPSGAPRETTPRAARPAATGTQTTIERPPRVTLMHLNEIARAERKEREHAHRNIIKRTQPAISFLLDIGFEDNMEKRRKKVLSDLQELQEMYAPPQDC
jgi:hypothetical protein